MFELNVDNLSENKSCFVFCVKRSVWYGSRSRSRVTHTAQCSALGSRREHSHHDRDQGYDHFRLSQHSVVTADGARVWWSGGGCHPLTVIIKWSGAGHRHSSAAWAIYLWLPSEGLHWPKLAEQTGIPDRLINRRKETFPRLSNQCKYFNVFSQCR